MILTDLFESAESPAIEAKRLMREWRDTAANEKYELTIDSSGSNSSNAFPVVRKAGTWYGGIFIPRGGNRKEANRMLGANHRAKAWIKSVLAPSLEKLIDAGREVRISDQSLGNSNSGFYEKVPVVKSGGVAAALAAHTVEKNHTSNEGTMKRLAVYWWVSTSADTADITTVNFHVTYGLITEPAKHAYLLFSLPKDEARSLASKVVELRKAQPGKAALLARQLVQLAEPNVVLNKNELFSLGVGLNSSSNYFKKVDTEEALKVIEKFL